MTSNEVYLLLVEKFGDAVFDYRDLNSPDDAPVDPNLPPARAPKKPLYFDPYFYVKAEKILEISQFLKSDQRLQFDSLMALSGFDPQDGKLRAVYHLFSYRLRHKVTFRVDVPLEKPQIPTTFSVWGIANWFEREIFDLFGIEFSGHPNLKRIMLPDDWEGYPLRKDFVAKTDRYD